MISGYERRSRSIVTHLETADLGTRALEHAVGLMVLGTCVLDDPTSRVKLVLGTILAADLVEPHAGKDNIDMISVAKSRIYQRLLFVEPDLKELIVGERTNLARMREGWADHVGMAYQTLVIDGNPRGVMPATEIQIAILENRADFWLPGKSKVAA